MKMMSFVRVSAVETDPIGDKGVPVYTLIVYHQLILHGQAIDAVILEDLKREKRPYLHASVKCS